MQWRDSKRWGVSRHSRAQAKTSIEGMLDKFLADTDNDGNLKPVEASTPKILDPGPVAPYAPTGNEAKPGKSLTH